MTEPVTITIAGPIRANAGLASRILALCANRLGWHIFGLPQQDVAADFADISVNISQAPIGCLNERIDLLGCFDIAAWERHAGTLNANAIVLVDADIDITIPRRKKLRIIRLPIARLAREIGGHPHTRTSVVAAAVAALAEIPLIDLQSALESIIPPGEILGHMRAAKVAHQAIQEQPGRLAMPASSAHHSNLLLSGYQAATIGAMAGGATFIATSNTTDLPLANLNEYQKDFPLVLQKAPDIQQVASQAMGAGIAGARSLVISNGSIAQLADSYQAAAMSETPLVFLHCSSNSEHFSPDQQELKTALSMGGDVSHVVVAPANPEEMFGLVQESFNIAESLQTPVIVLCDRQLAHGLQSTSDLSTLNVSIQRGQLLSAKQSRSTSGYARYQATNNGISPRKVPGQPGDIFVTNSFNHNDKGLPGLITDYTNQAEKRLHKTDRLLDSGLPYKLHGSADADVTLVCFGSVTGTALRASEVLNQQEIATNILQIVFLAPFPAVQIHQIFRGSKHLMLVDASAAGQLGHLIRQETGIGFHHKVLATGGATIYPEQIIRAVKRTFTHA